METEKKLEEDIQRKTRLLKRLRRDVIIKSAVFISAAVITFTFIFGITHAPTNDMFPAVHEGDMLIYYRPGRIVNRSGLYEETYAGEKDLCGDIKQDEFLILGDSRETASDSRTFGLMGRKAIKGKVFTIIRRRPL